MRDQEVEVLPLPVGSAHRVAHQDPVAALSQGVLQLSGELAEEGQRHGGHDDAHGLSRLAVQGPGDLVGTVAQLLDRLRDAELGGLGEVAAVVQYA